MVTAADAVALAGARPQSPSYTLTLTERARVKAVVESAVYAGAKMVSMRDVINRVGASSYSTDARRAAVAAELAALPVTGGGVWAGTIHHEGRDVVGLIDHPLRTGAPEPWTLEYPAVEAAILAAAGAQLWSMTISLSAGPTPGHYRIGSGAAHPHHVVSLDRGDALRVWTVAVTGKLLEAGFEVRQLGTPTENSRPYLDLQAAMAMYGPGAWCPMAVSW